VAGETEVLRGNLPQCRSVHHRSHMTWPRLEPGPPRSEAGDCPPELRHVLTTNLTLWKGIFLFGFQTVIHKIPLFHSNVSSRGLTLGHLFVIGLPYRTKYGKFGLKRTARSSVLILKRLIRQSCLAHKGCVEPVFSELISRRALVSARARWPPGRLTVPGARTCSLLSVRPARQAAVVSLPL
jgi:hypothetical protein